jgi:hypothetical protein
MDDASAPGSGALRRCSTQYDPDSASTAPARNPPNTFTCMTLNFIALPERSLRGGVLDEP